MTAAQIDILLKDGDISERPGQKFCRKDDCSFHTTNKCYYISIEMYQIFEKLFDWYGSGDGWWGAEYGYDTGEIDGMLRAQIEHRKNSPGAKLKILEDILEDQYQKLKTKIGQITFHNNPEQIIESWFFYFFLYDGEAIVKSLKFDLLKGEKLSSFTMDGYRNFLLQNKQFEKYFHTEDMQMIYDVISVEKSIKHIQNLIAGKEESKEITYQAIAILYIIKGKSLETIPECKLAIQEYNKNRNQPKALQTFYKKLANHKDGILLDIDEPKTRNERISCLNLIYSFLNEKEKMQADNYIQSIKIIKNNK